MLRSAWLPLLVLLPLLSSCGWRTGLDDEIDASSPEAPEPQPEACNSLDDDLDGSVDEDYRDGEGHYTDRDHCGACGMPCAATRPNEVETSCELIEGVPVCAAQLCADGFQPSSTGRCVDAFERLCLGCTDDGDCGDRPTTLCEEVGGELRCTLGCELGCPGGFDCVDDRCVPSSGSCSCGPGDAFDVACRLEDPDGLACVGSARCEGSGQSECVSPAEVCDEVDNDCDGSVDEGYRDENGAYHLDVHHCGRCGVDCSLSTTPEGDLKCGGDPFAPRCVLECPDELDGFDPGDRVDGDGDIANGCECTITSPVDAPGPVGASAELLDVNCDGADGVVLESFYVATDGDDSGPGSPSLPLASLDEAVRLAAATLDGPSPRPDVYVASGSYVETVELLDGVKIHGGYRRDFRALDPNGFRVEILAPADTDASGGAALVADGVGSRETLVEWTAIRGADAGAIMRAAFGVVLLNPGGGLVIRENEIRAGVPASGASGANGEAGASPSLAARAGDDPRAASESAAHLCLDGPANVVAGGEGGANFCGRSDVAGGGGGSPSCPSFASFQPSGWAGSSPSMSGGAGGLGGQDSRGPVVGFSCPSPVCCGLADFIVPSNFVGPESGGRGGDGAGGAPGEACLDPAGFFLGPDWQPQNGTGGTGGVPGAGGGGGGAGGGAELEWMADVCEFADGLGGGGGGGGAGGCGGEAGLAGTSGAPSAAVLIRRDDGGAALPVMSRNVIAPSDGGRGGDGGAGGGGGIGGAGAFGGELPRDQRSIPTLAGPFPGGRGGQGGKGGSAGGGGGGCGGGSVGVWLHGLGATEPPEAAEWRMENTFRLGRGGAAGRGGGGDVPAPDGAEGGAHDVLVL